MSAEAVSSPSWQRLADRARRGARRRFRARVAAADDAALARLDGRRGRAVVALLFAVIPLQLDRRAARRLSAAVELRVTEADGGATLHTLLIADGRCRVRRGVVAEPDLTLELSAADFLRLAAGLIDGMTLALDGRLRVRGDLALAFRLPHLFRTGGAQRSAR